MNIFKTVVHSDAEAISTDFIPRKNGKVYVTSSDESDWNGY